MTLPIEGNSFLSAMVDQPGSVVVLLDAQSNFLYANELALGLIQHPQNASLLERIKSSEFVENSDPTVSSVSVRHAGEMWLLTGIRNFAFFEGANQYQAFIAHLWRSDDRVLIDMQNQREYLYNIVDTLPHFIFWKDRRSRFLGCNRKFADSVNMRVDQIIGLTDYDMPWSREESDKYKIDDEEIMRSGIPCIGYEESQKQRDGADRVMSVSKVPLYLAGKVAGIVGIYSDVTEKKQQEEALQRAKEQAEAANEVKTEFIHNMEHDIRTPFNGIWGIANILWERETDPEKRELLGDITQSAKELLGYCNGILDFSRIETGEVPVRSEKFLLHRLIRDLVIMEKPAAIHKELDFSCDIDKDVPAVVIGDSYRLRRIIMNLISNAIKFTAVGEIKLKITAPIVSKDDRSAIVRIIVSDTGSGIPSDKLNYIYEKFSRLSPSNRGIHKGLGLGLKIVKQFVEELGGELEVKSELDKGTTFACTLLFKLPLVGQMLR